MTTLLILTIIILVWVVVDSLDKDILYRKNRQ